MKNTFLIALLQLPKIGPVSAYNIIKSTPFQVSSLKTLEQALKEAKQKLKRIPDFTTNDIEQAVLKAEKISLKCKELNIDVISLYDKNYSRKLLEISNPPIVIYVKGSLDTLNGANLMAVIGTREPSHFALQEGYVITKHCISNNYTIVSGLAQGCDTMAHNCALENNGKTIAILPSGLDKIVPKQNVTLANQILENNGALISEYPPGTAPQRNYFIQRNRLQTALSSGLIIIETALKSGSMHTFKFAKTQNKPVGVWFHPEKNYLEKSAGNLKILQDKAGAKLETIKDVTDFINHIQNQSTKEIQCCS